MFSDGNVNRPGSVSLSPVAGTQLLDGSWGALKKFLPPRIGAKRKLKGHSCLNPAVKQMLYMWCWRASLGAQSPKEFLRAREGRL